MPDIRAFPEWMFFIPLMLFLACTTGPGKRTSGPAEPLVWPPPPDQPRIRYVQTISSQKDLGVKEPALRKLWKGIVGESQRGRIQQPYGIDTLGDEIFVVDTFVRAMYVFNRENGTVRRIPGEGKGPLVSPIDVALSPEGPTYVSDSETGRVYAYDRKGRFLHEIGGGGELKRPTGIAVNPLNLFLYVVDTAGHQVIAYDESGQFRFRFGNRGRGEGEFNFPTHIFIDPQGTVYVTDFLNFRIQLFDSAGTFLGKVGSLGDGWENLEKPKGVAVDREGHIYVVDAITDLVKIFDRAGRLLLCFGGTGSGPGQFWLPSGIHIDQENNVYVADSLNQRIQVFQFIPQNRQESGVTTP